MRMPLFVLMSVVLSQASLGQPPLIEKPTLGYEVRPVLKANGWCLEFKITNEGNQPISVFASSIPWISVDALILVAVRTEPRIEVIEELGLIQDFMPVVERKGSRQTISGEVFLRERYLHWDRVVEKGDIVVLWSFRLRAPDAMEFERQAGAFVASKLPPTQKQLTPHSGAERR